MSFLDRAKSESTVWIDYLPYANRLFAAGRTDLWSNEDTFISICSQGQSLLRSDVISIPIHNFYKGWLSQNEGWLQSLEGKKATFVLKKILATDEPKHIIKNVLSGLGNLYMGAKPIVLELPSPQLWLHWLYQKVRHEKEVAIGENEIEAAAMYLAEYLRGFSAHGLAAIVLEENNQPVLTITKAVPLYKPIINVAKHYQWQTGLLINGPSADLIEKKNEIDFYLVTESGFSKINELSNLECNVGGGLNDHFWLGQEVPANFANTKLMYGKVPEHADPETVLLQLKQFL